MTGLYHGLTRARAPEPCEADDPVNALVDLAERAVEIAVENGGEAALRVRLARLLPDAVQPPLADRPPAAERALGFARVLELINRFRARRVSNADWELAVACESIVRAEIKGCLSGCRISSGTAATGPSPIEGELIHGAA